MATSKTVAKREEVEHTSLVLSDETRALFASMVTAIPDADGDGQDRILLALLNAKSWDELNDPWDSTRSDALVDVEQRIDSIVRRPSAYADGLGVFLVVRGKRLDDDQEVTWSTGSVSVVGQLVKAFMLGAFPLYATLRKAERATQRGYFPLHLEISASAGPGAIAQA